MRMYIYDIMYIYIYICVCIQSQSQTPSVFGMTGTVTTQGQAAFAPQPVNDFAVPPQAPAFNHYSKG